MSDEISAAPTPWKVADRYVMRDARDIRDANGALVAVGVSSADARLIVDAVNNRTKMLSIIRSLLYFEDNQNWCVDTKLAVLDTARELVAQYPTTCGACGIFSGLKCGATGDETSPNNTACLFGIPKENPAK